MPVFIIRSPLGTDGCFELSLSDQRHLSKTLRLKAGDEFEILLPNQEKALAVLEKTPQGFQGRYQKKLKNITERQVPIWLALGMFRWTRFEWLIEKATELGVQRITPLFLTHSQQSPKASFEKKMERLHRIAEETKKQCERTLSPRIDSPVTLSGFLENLDKHSGFQRILLNEQIQEPIFCPSILKNKASFLFVLGPEGGLHPQEIERLEEQDFQSVSLGETLLKVETAAIYAAMTIDHWVKTQNILSNH